MFHSIHTIIFGFYILALVLSGLVFAGDRHKFESQRVISQQAKFNTK